MCALIAIHEGYVDRLQILTEARLVPVPGSTMETLTQFCSV